MPPLSAETRQLPRHLFFYGTLVAGNSNPVATSIHAALEPLGQARTGGVLYAIPDPAGWFPALVQGDGTAMGGALTGRPFTGGPFTGGAVGGALYRATAGFDLGLLAQIDAYEEFDPSDPTGSLYRRVPLMVRTGDNVEIEAAAYLWNCALPPGAARVSGGHFGRWLEETGHRVFGAIRSAVSGETGSAVSGETGSAVSGETGSA